MTGRSGPDATALLDDPAEAASIHARGFYGTVEGSTLTLDRFESVYLSEMGRVALTGARGRPVEWPDLFRAAQRADREFGVHYVVYRDLRQRGYVVRASPPPVSFAVLPRGGTLHKTPARYWVETISERSEFEIGPLLALADRALGARKLLLLGLVDEESDLTYYRVRSPVPTGTLDFTAPPTAAIGWWSGDRVVLFDPEAVRTLGEGAGSFGSLIGGRLEISVIEAEYLRSAGRLVLRDARTGREVPEERFLKSARSVEEGFDERLAAYRALRGQRLLAKTGFKYGAHFRAYVRTPDRVHARYLVRAIATDRTVPWPEIAGGVRLAQGVRKEFLIAAVPKAGNVRFLSLERVRP